MPQTVNLRTPEGETVAVPVDQVAGAIQQGFRPESVDELLERQVTGAREEKYGGVGGTLVAGGAGFLRGATLGLSDVALGAVGGESGREDLAAFKEVNPIASTVGEVGGALATAIPSGGGSLLAKTPGAMITRLGSKIAAEGGEGLIRKVAATTKAGFVEGAAAGGGSYISDVALGNKELSAEGFLASVGKGGLYGGAAGGALALGERAVMSARRLFPKQEMTREAVIKAQDEAREVVSAAARDTDDAIRSARLRMRELREQRAALDLTTKAELDQIAIAKARELADAQVSKARAQAEAAAARAERAKAPPASKSKARKGKGAAAPKTAPASVAAPAPGGAASVADDAQTALERQLAAMKGAIDGGETLQSLRATHVEDALNAHVAKVDPEMAELHRAVTEAEAGKDAVTSWLEKYGKGGQVGRFERSQAARDVADSWRSKEPGYYSKLPIDPRTGRTEGSRGVPRGRTWEFRGSEADRVAAEERFYARQGGREMLEADTVRQFPGGEQVPAFEAGDLDAQLKAALGARTDDIDIDVSDLADAVGRMESSAADLADALGPAAPIGAQERARAFREAQRKADDAVTRQAVDAVADADRVAVQGAPAAAKGAGSRGALETAASAGEVVELLNMLGVPVPDVGKIPVVGPVLQQVLRARVVGKAFARFGGKVPQTAENVIASKAASAKERVYKAVDRMLEVGGKAMGKAAPRAGTTAAILGDAIFENEQPSKSSDPLELFRARSEEIARATPEAIRMAVRQRVRADNPEIVDAIAATEERKISYLSKQLPRPDQPDGLLGGLPWTPSRSAIREFATSVEAVQDPIGVLERAAAGGVVNPLAIEAIREVYPQLFGEAQQYLVRKVADGTIKLSAPRRVALSLMFDLPLDPSADPQFSAWLQDGYKPKPQQPQGPQPMAPTIRADVNLGSRVDPGLGGMTP